MKVSDPPSNTNAIAKTRTRKHGGSGNGGSTSNDSIILIFLGILMLYGSVTAIAYYKLSFNAGDDEELPSSPLFLQGFGGIESDGNNAAAKLSGGVADNEEDLIHSIQTSFPIHTETDMEVIAHPGLSFVENKDIPPGLSPNMTVPKFFEDSHGFAYGGSIRKYMGGGNRLMTPEEAKSIGSFDASGQETIYCSVASYRDPECRATVEDIYSRAKHPERIRVAIVDQRVNGDPICSEPEKHCSEDPTQALCKYRDLIDVYEMDAQLGIGPVFARHLAHRHYRGEYFAMQVDSHVRMVQDWDETIIKYWKSANNEMAVLTTYLSDLQGRIDPKTHQATNEARPIMCESDYEGSGQYKHLRHGQQPEGMAGIRGQPTLQPFWAAGFSFARGHFVIQVPYDQYLPMIFQGEEISIGLRGFTHGYDYYSPETGVCYHMYATNAPDRHKVPLFWEHSRLYHNAGQSAMRRLNSIIGMDTGGRQPYHRDEEEKYGLGTVRSTEKFFKVFGIHTKSQTVEKHLCQFVGKPMMRVFMPALRDNHMGLDYSKINYEFVDPRKEGK